MKKISTYKILKPKTIGTTARFSFNLFDSIVTLKMAESKSSLPKYILGQKTLSPGKIVFIYQVQKDDGSILSETSKLNDLNFMYEKINFISGLH